MLPPSHLVSFARVRVWMWCFVCVCVRCLEAALVVFVFGELFFGKRFVLVRVRARLFVFGGVFGLNASSWSDNAVGCSPDKFDICTMLKFPKQKRTCSRIHGFHLKLKDVR